MDRLKQTLTDLVTSKKFLAASVAALLYVVSRLLGRLGIEVDPAVIDRFYVALLVYTGAQGVADIGKGAAQVQAQVRALADREVAS